MNIIGTKTKLGKPVFTGHPLGERAAAWWLKAITPALPMDSMLEIQTISARSHHGSRQGDFNDYELMDFDTFWLHLNEKWDTEPIGVAPWGYNERVWIADHIDDPSSGAVHLMAEYCHIWTIIGDDDPDNQIWRRGLRSLAGGLLIRPIKPQKKSQLIELHVSCITKMPITLRHGHDAFFKLRGDSRLHGGTVAGIWF